MNSDWSKFLGRPDVGIAPALAESVVGGRRVLITGAGGSIGAGLARAAAGGHPALLVLLDSSEHALYECLRHLDIPSKVTPVVGSCSDSQLLDYVFEQHKPDLVFHAAAYKHVPLMELNPFAAIANNSIGTYRLVMAALEAGVSNFVMVSTDKAVNPRSIMGASKRIAELVVLSHTTPEVRMNAVRLGNVLGSSGSVVPVFQEQAASRAALTVTHPEATRYFITPAEAEAAILQSAASGPSAKILVPECGEPLRIVDLARYIAGDSALPIEFIGLRPGDKLHEELISQDEEVAAERVAGMRVVTSLAPTAEAVALAVARLEKAIIRFDHSLLLDAVSQLVPNYQRASDSMVTELAAIAEAQ